MERGHRVGSLRRRREESGAWSASGKGREKDGMMLNDGTVDLITWTGLALGFTCFLVWSGSVGVGVDIHIVYTHIHYEDNM